MRFRRVLSLILLIIGLAIPFILFLNRFLIPDVSVDSLRVHYYLGFKAFHPQNNQFEFFPTGIYNYTSILQTVGYLFSILMGYRAGTIFSIVAIYFSVGAIYKIYKLYNPNKRITDDLITTFLFVSSFLSFELFLGIATYYIDGLVAALSLWCGYFLLKYFSKLRLVDLVYSSFILSILILGKQTNLFLAVTYFVVLLVFLVKKGKGWFKTIMLAGIISLLLPAIWYLNNCRITGNPVFPYYNAIFKSKYYGETNYGETVFGGVGLWQKVMWFYYSMLTPLRLGQAHDLFNDFKLNLSVVLVGVYWLITRIKKSRLAFDYLIFLFLLGYLVWSMEFGYLRYGLVLEYWGGLLILLIYEKLGKTKYLFFVPLIGWLLLVNKRVVNMALAYDIGFRPGYFYNRVSYPKEKEFLHQNQIMADSKVVDFRPEVYLNCSSVDMTYYTLSSFNNLPVVNIEQSAHKIMTNNINYQKEVLTKLRNYLKDDKEIRFVTISAKTGMNTEYENCLVNLKKLGMTIKGEAETKFLGYSNQTLVTTWGTAKANVYGNQQ